MLRNWTAAILVGLVFFGMARESNATLIGDEILISHTIPFGFFRVSESSPTVGSGIESVLITGSAEAFSLDVNENSITVTRLITASPTPFGISFNDAPFDDRDEFLVFSDLDWLPVPGEITGALLSISGTILGLSASDVETTADSVRIEVGDTLFDPGASFTVALQTTHAVVPEPASIALFGLGLAGFGFLSRRRRPFLNFR